MEKTIKVINQMQKKNVIAKYAIGGGIAAIFYMEYLLKIFGRHGLLDKWQNFRKQFYDKQ